MTVKLLSALLCATAAVAAEPKPSPIGHHVWDSAALARCSSPYQREVVADPQARSGQAVRFTGSAGFISMHDEVGIAPGRSRFTVQLRLEKGGRFTTDLEAGILLANYSDRERSVRLRLVAESGINTEEVLPQREVALPATTALQSITFKLPVLPKAGYQLRAEALEGDKVVSTARDIFVVTDRPLRAGQYGNFSIHQPYSAAAADANVAAFRRNFVTVAEIDFWAPCDMSQLVPPPVKPLSGTGPNSRC